MIRPMRRTDAPDVLALLEWMDDRPDREVFAPESRTLQDLRIESEDKLCLVAEDTLGQVTAYCALAPLRDTDGARHVLEGPLGEGPLAPLVERIVADAGGGVYAFCAQTNETARTALECAGFSAMHATDFWTRTRPENLPTSVLPAELSFTERVGTDTYRTLYRSGEDVWSERLGWSEAQLRAHFAREDVRVRVLRRGGVAVGFVELELAETARLTYLAVHPAERGHGYGRALLHEAMRTAFAEPEVRRLRVRAHEHEVAARALYRTCGFEPSRSVVTYLRDSDVRPSESERARDRTTPHVSLIRPDARAR